MNLAEAGRRPKTIRKTRMCLAATSTLGLCTTGCQEPQSGTNYVAVPRNENIMYSKVSPGDGQGLSLRKIAAEVGYAKETVERHAKDDCYETQECTYVWTGTTWLVDL